MPPTPTPTRRVVSPAVAASVPLAFLSIACASTGAPLGEPHTAGRPFVSTDADTVAPRAFELEAGYTFDETRSREVSAELKYGVGERSQINVAWSPWIHIETPGGDEFGIGNLELAWKQRVIDAHDSRPGIGVEVGAVFPTGSRGEDLGSGQTDVFAALFATYDVSGWRLGGYAEIAALGQPGADKANAEHTFTVSVVSPFIGRCALLAELIHSRAPEDHEEGTFATLAATWNPDDVWILDLGYRAAIDDTSPDWAVTFGFTRTFGE